MCGSRRKGVGGHDGGPGGGLLGTDEGGGSQRQLTGLFPSGQVLLRIHAPVGTAVVAVATAVVEVDVEYSFALMRRGGATGRTVGTGGSQGILPLHPFGIRRIDAIRFQIVTHDVISD